MILIDTNVFVALVDASDRLAERAARDGQRLRRSAFATTGTILSEACFLLPRAHLRRRLRLLIQGLAIAVLEFPAAWWDDVFDWLERYEEHEPDLADAQLAVLCSKQRDHRVWTYDSEFRTTWRRPDGTPIPLAARPPARR